MPAERPFREGVWDERETWSRDRLEAYKLTGLQVQLARLAETSPFYLAALMAFPARTLCLSSQLQPRRSLQLLNS